MPETCQDAAVNLNTCHTNRSLCFFSFFLSSFFFFSFLFLPTRGGPSESHAKESEQKKDIRDVLTAHVTIALTR